MNTQDIVKNQRARDSREHLGVSLMSPKVKHFKQEAANALTVNYSNKPSMERNSPSLMNHVIVVSCAP